MHHPLGNQRTDISKGLDMSKKLGRDIWVKIMLENISLLLFRSLQDLLIALLQVIT